jgi:hypothetical protein
MLNPYKYHTNPDALHNFENSWKLSDKVAADYLIVHPGHEGAQAKLATSSVGVMYYVEQTKKPFPAGLPRLVPTDLVTYAQFTGERLPKEYETKLINNRDVWLIVRYVDDIIKGPWKEAEQVIADSGNESRIDHYVSTWLGGDRSKFNTNPTDVVDVTGWKERVTRAIDIIIDDINFINEENTDEDEDAPEEIYLTYNYKGPRIRIHNARNDRLLGSIRKVDREPFAICLAADDSEIVKISLADTRDRLHDILYKYVQTITANI